MTSTDHELGKKIHIKLKNMGIETPMNYPPEDPTIIGASFRDIMQEGLGLDLTDDSLDGTPARIAKMYGQEVFYGLNYKNFPACTTVENKMGYDEAVVVKDADVLSVCEHHFVPFIGKACVAYLPSTKVLGLSKINRVVDFFSRRPQVQERLTEQIWHALAVILETHNIAIVIRAEHMCVRLRGVKQESHTITSKLGGIFRTKPEARAEFFALTR